MYKIVLTRRIRLHLPDQREVLRPRVSRKISHHHSTQRLNELKGLQAAGPTDDHVTNRRPVLLLDDGRNWLVRVMYQSEDVNGYSGR
jgi:hypothetical protein